MDVLLKLRFSGIGDLGRFWRSCLGPLVYLLPTIIWLSILSVPDEDYSRNVLCTLNLISTFYLRTNLHPGILYRNWYDHMAAYTRIVSKNSQYQLAKYQWAQHSSKYKLANFRLAESIHILSSFILFNRTDYRFHSSFELSNYRFVYHPRRHHQLQIFGNNSFRFACERPRVQSTASPPFRIFGGTVKYNTNNFVSLGEL